MEEKRSGENGGFIKGLFCGVLLVLICMAGALFWYRWKLNRALEQIRAQKREELIQEETETERTLELDREKVDGKMEEIRNLINLYYLDSLDSEEIEQGIYEGMVSGLEDPYSVYYSVEDLEKLTEAASGEYLGIGAVVTQDPETGTITILRCFEDTPSFEAGLQAGDVLVTLNGEEITGVELTKVVARIKTEPGDAVTLGYYRDGEEGEAQVERRNIRLPTVEWEMLDDGLGYLEILEFDTVTVGQFRTAMAELENQGMEKLIIDVRDNPGGTLQSVCEILDELLPEGVIVYTEDKYGNRQEFTSDAAHRFEKPLTVLVNENSASAAEVFSGAIKDYGLGTLVGTTTFGKGIVQRVFDLSDGSGVKLTVSKYFTPDGNDIHEKGITPDLEVTADPETEEDDQLQAAIDILNQSND